MNKNHYSQESDTAANRFSTLDLKSVDAPCLVLDLACLENNLRRLSRIAREANVKILLALKAFACTHAAALIGRYLHGTAASGLYEARLGREYFGGEVHCYAPGLKMADLEAVLDHSDHLIFNSYDQFIRYAPHLPQGGYGLRINPRHSETENPFYDPCAPWSRLGVIAEALAQADLSRINGFHVHGLTDQGYEPFDRLLNATEAKFGRFFSELDWVNLGGGQLLTLDDYPSDRLIERLLDFKRRTGLDVYLEPGTAVLLHAGAFVTEVLDTGYNEGHFAIVDISAVCHTPDVLEAPYTPDILGARTVDAGDPAIAAEEWIYRIGGPTCLAGDNLGYYAFSEPLYPGQRLLILDQAYYTSVKSTHFNGTPLPSLALWPANSAPSIVQRYSYRDFAHYHVQSHEWR